MELEELQENFSPQPQPRMSSPGPLALVALNYCRGLPDACLAVPCYLYHCPGREVERDCDGGDANVDHGFGLGLELLDSPDPVGVEACMQAHDAHKDNIQVAPRFGTPLEEGRNMVAVYGQGMPPLGEEEEEEEGKEQALALGHLHFEDDPCFPRNTDRVRVGIGLCGCCHEFDCSSLRFRLLLFLDGEQKC